jgi:hypothetical protein
VDRLISAVDRHGTEAFSTLFSFCLLCNTIGRFYELICLPRVDRDEQHVRLHPPLGL